MILDKAEICNILGIKNKTLRNIENKGNLKSRLIDKGYELIDKFKDGRKVYYEVERMSNNKEVYSNLCKYVYNVNKENEFSKYFTTRTLSNSNSEFPLNCADIADVSNVSSKTITTWDKTLTSKDIIRKDGFYYFCLDTTTGNITMCDVEEYKNFWKNKGLMSALYKLQQRYYRGEITLNELQLASMDIGVVITAVEGKYYFRTKKYITNIENELYIDTIKLIADLKKEMKN